MRKLPSSLCGSAQGIKRHINCKLISVFHRLNTRIELKKNGAVCKMKARCRENNFFFLTRRMLLFIYFFFLIFWTSGYRKKWYPLIRLIFPLISVQLLLAQIQLEMSPFPKLITSPPSFDPSLIKKAPPNKLIFALKAQ